MTVDRRTPPARLLTVISGSLVLLLSACHASTDEETSQADSNEQQQITLPDDPDALSFTVEVQELAVDFSPFFAIAMPDEVLEFEVQIKPDSRRSFSFDSPGAADTIEGPFSLAWQAPAAPGVYPVTITAEDTGEVMALNVLVMRPLSEMSNNALSGYRIGQYPSKPLRGNPAYLPPAGLIEYSPDMKGLSLSPNFTLDQFLCKQATNSEMKYLLVKPALILKLETLLAEVQSRGIVVDTFFVMSGYRTPFYNKAIGNVPYSRHVWGDAADIYIDHAPKDGSMDDINGDGKRNRADAGHLYRIAEHVDTLVARTGLSGGVGEYGANSAHGPFVHVDTRGTPARWGHK